MEKAKRIYLKCLANYKYSLAIKIAEKHNLTEEKENVKLLKTIQKSAKKDYRLLLLSTFLNSFLFMFYGYYLCQNFSIGTLHLFVVVLIMIFCNYKVFKSHNEFKKKLGL